MSRFFAAVLVGLAAAAAARAHALYIVPAADGRLVVVFSDDLEPDDRVKDATWQKLGGLELSARPADGPAAPVAWKKADHRLTAAAPVGTVVVFGAADYGVSAKADPPAFVRFFPKAVVGPVPADGGATGAALEVVPAAAGGKVRFRVLAAGKPVAAAAVKLMLPDGAAGPAEAATDGDGYTPEYTGAGRYAVTVRRSAAEAGEVDGRTYERALHVATLVFDVR